MPILRAIRDLGKARRFQDRREPFTVSLPDYLVDALVEELFAQARIPEGDQELNGHNRSETATAYRLGLGMVYGCKIMVTPSTMEELAKL